MKKLYGKLASLAMTSTLAASWYMESQSLQVFSQALYWILISITALAFLVVTHYIAEFDEGNGVDSESVKRFKSFHGKTAFDKVFNAAMSMGNIAILIAINAPVLSALYLISAIASIKFTSSCSKRYLIAKDRIEKA